MKKTLCLFLSISLIFINFGFAQSQSKSNEKGMSADQKILETQETEPRTQVRVKTQLQAEPKKKGKAILPIVLSIVVVGGIVGYLLLKKSDESEEAHYMGTVTDPVGDSIYGVVGQTHDLESAKIEITGQEAIFEVHFASGTFDDSLTKATLSLDIDQNPSTGHPGINAGGVDDADVIGVEYLIKMGPRGSDYGAFVWEYTGVFNSFDLIETAPVTKLSDGFRVSIPLAVIGGDDGRMNFKVVSTFQLNPKDSGTSGVLDYMPDIGLPAGEVK